MEPLAILTVGATLALSFFVGLKVADIAKQTRDLKAMTGTVKAILTTIEIGQAKIISRLNTIEVSIDMIPATRVGAAQKEAIGTSDVFRSMAGSETVGDWINWQGNDDERPAFAPGELFQVQFRDGNKIMARAPNGLRWTHWGTNGDIIAYRVVH